MTRPYGRVVIGLASLIGSMAVAVGASAPATADAAGKGGDFVALSPPAAVLDTRNGTGVPVGQIGAQGVKAFQVLGVGGIPASGVSAVLVDATVVNSSAATFFTLFPDGTTRPVDVTMVHASANQVISNSAVVPVGSNGKISLYNNAGNAHAVVDVQGYFTSQQTTTGGGFVPLGHTWLPVGPPGPDGRPLTEMSIPANGSQTVTITGGVVPAGASAAFVNLHASADARGWLAAYPAGGSGPRSVMDFQTGTNSNAASLKLPANGQVTFVNHSSDYLRLSLNALGYATASPTTGAGFRTVTADRLLDTRVGGGTGIPDGGVKIQVGGTNGLPTRGIAGVVLNITTITTGNARELVVPCPDGMFCVPEYRGQFITAFPGGTTRSSLVVAGVDSNGQLHLDDRGIAMPGNPPPPVHLLVDLHGWFSSPLPALPLNSYAPTVAMQGAPSGTALQPITYSYVDNIGTVRIGQQSNVDDFSTVQWTPISGADAFTGRPTLSQLPDGRIQVGAQNVDSDVWTSSQVSANGTTWQPFADLGGSMAAPPTAARLSTGATVLFAVGPSGNLWHLRSADEGWRLLGGTSLTGSVAVGAVQDGLRLFVRDTAGNVQTATYGNDGFLSAWASLGGAGSTGTPAVVMAPGYRARVVIRAADGSLVTKMQDANLAFPTAWSPVGTFTAAGSPAAILDPVLNRVAVVARGTDNEVYRSFETAQGSGVFGEWRQLNPDVSDPAASDPTVAPVTNASGQTWLVVFRNLNDGTRVYVRDQLTLSAARAQRTSEFVGHTLPAPPA